MVIVLHFVDHPPGFAKPVACASMSVRRDPLALPAETEDTKYVLDTDIPVALDVFFKNFDKFEVDSGVVQLQGGESLTGRRIDPGDVSETYPLALARANDVSIFSTL